MNLEVDNGNDETLVCASSSKCNVKYRWDYTPNWYEMMPKVLYPGIMTTLKVHPRSTMNYRKANTLPFDWRLDGTAVDMTGYHDTTTSLASWTSNYVKGKVMS